MSNWKHEAADANLRMAKKMLDQQEEVNILKTRIKTALSYHVSTAGGFLCKECGYPWDNVFNHCTSPTVITLIGKDD